MKKQKYIECKTQEEASDADVESLLKRELPKTRGAMCILACANEKFGLVIFIWINGDEFLYLYCRFLIQLGRRWKTQYWTSHKNDK